MNIKTVIAIAGGVVGVGIVIGSIALIRSTKNKKWIDASQDRLNKVIDQVNEALKPAAQPQVKQQTEPTEAKPPLQTQKKTETTTNHPEPLVKNAEEPVVIINDKQSDDELKAEFSQA